jgi:2-polyprenyl-3-methyl-5-hydroxy-6-metoxy-1,4-benzoquinol methylase
MTNHRPAYDCGPQNMLRQRAPRAAAFARQILQTVRPFLPLPVDQLSVLDVGCGYGHTALELARQCRRVVGIDPCRTLFDHARTLKEQARLPNLEFYCRSAEHSEDVACYDLAILDNVLEHMADQPAALRQVVRSLRPGGILFLLVPNKLWPIEVHYRLPFLSWLPLRLANLYLRVSARGSDYTDASFAPTYRGLNRLLRQCRDLSFRYVLPADLSLATMGRSLHYRLGAAAIRRWPWLWAIAKTFLVVGVKQ